MVKHHQHHGESIVLARLRTLMALERNYLAEERTNLAEFRTGLALTIIGPPSSLLSLTSNWNDLTNYILFSIFAVITIYGLFMVLKAQKKLKVIRKNKRNIHEQEEKIINESTEAKDLLMDTMDPYCDFEEKHPVEFFRFE